MAHSSPPSRPSERIHLGKRPIEARLALETVKRAIYVGPPLVVLFWLIRGVDGAVASLVGVVTVVAYFLLMGVVLSGAARISLAFYQAATLFGFLLRLVLISVTLVGLAQLFDFDRPALGITVVAAYVVLLSWESVVVSRAREREWSWNQ